MKCVKNIATKTGSKIKRLPDDMAAALVEKPEWEYCPKWMWKDQEGKEYRGERL